MSENRTVFDFYYDYIIYQWDLHQYKDALGDWDAIGMTSMPKMEEDMANVGILTFLMVNPQSENLEEALQYISDFSKYMLKQKDNSMYNLHRTRKTVAEYICKEIVYEAFHKSPRLSLRLLGAWDAPDRHRPDPDPFRPRLYPLLSYRARKRLRRPLALALLCLLG